MTLEEKQELINSATSEQELEERMKAINEDKEEEVVEEKEEKTEEITVEEERSLLKASKEIEKRSVVVNTIGKEDVKMEKEVRNSKAYIEAYAQYIKDETKMNEEQRKLLSTNAEGGKIAVPDFVLDEIKTAWEKSDIMSLVKKTEVAGNLKIDFEISGSDAVIHAEGTAAIAEETLTHGIVTIIPANIKKWISISDEVMDLRGESFLRYVYKELTYKIVKKAADELVSKIIALPATATATSVSANVVNGAIDVDTIAKAISNLSDEAENPVIIMNKLTFAAFKKVQYKNGYGVDVFEGLDVKFNNSIPAYDTTKTQTYAIVGDLGHGALANFPNGEDVKFIFDELTGAQEDLVKITGKEFVGLGLIADKSFVKLTTTKSV